MADKIEEAALSGKLFANPAPTSPPRQRSPSPSGSASRRRRASSELNTDDELGSDLDEPASDPSRSTAAAAPAPSAPTSIPRHTTGTSGNTGSKGVIADARSAASSAAAAREAQIHAVRENQARRAMVGLTVHEEDEARRQDAARAEAGEKTDERAKWNREDAEDALAREKWRAQRRAEIERNKGREEDGLRRSKMGGIREVGREGFIRAVEREGWVLVLIYEPGISRCTALTASLISLSLTLSSLSHSPSDALSAPLPPLSLYRARARALRFSLLPPTEGIAEAEEVDELNGFDGETDGVEYDDESGLGDRYDLDVDEQGNPLGRPDPDVLPTLLAYRDGELVKTWVRVDWEVGQDGVEGLLKREGILPRGESTQNTATDDD